MSRFIKPVCFIGHVGDPDCHDLPPPPFPPDGDNPTHAYLPADDGLKSADIEFTPGADGIMVRVYGRVNEAAPLNLTATIHQDAAGVTTDLTTLAVAQVNALDSAFCFIAAGHILPNEPARLVFTLDGSGGRAHVRIGDFGVLPPDFADTFTDYGNASGDGSTDNYYCESGPVPANAGLVLSVVGWLTESADTIEATGDYPQFTGAGGSGVEGAAVYFGVIEAPGGEPGWGGYVWYSNGAQYRRPNALMVAIPGASLPT